MTKVAEQIEQVFRLVDREIWIVTAAAEGQRGGLTATWVSQASIDSERPLAMIGLAPNHYTSELVDASNAFALHLLAADQIDVAWTFAQGSGRDRDKFAGTSPSSGQTGSPILEPCLAWLECQVFARLPTADRIYYLADVVAGDVQQAEAAGGPLTEQQFIRQLPADRREQLKASRQADISVQRPLLEGWRKQIPDLIRWPHGEPSS